MSAQKRTPDTAAFIAGGIGLVALAVWIAMLLTPTPQEDAVDAQTAPPVSQATPAVTPASPRTPEPAISETAAPKSAEAPPPAVPAAAPKAPDAEPKRKVKPEAKPAPAEQSASAPSPRTSAAAKADAADPKSESLRGRRVGTIGDSGFTLEIENVSGSGVSGTATHHGQACRGRYPVEGTFRGNRLQMRAPRNGGPAGDCPLAFAVELDGERLVGATDSGEKIFLRR